MKVSKYKKSIAIGAIAIGLLGAPMISKASNDNVDFNFSLKEHYGNSTTAARYRQTTNVKNKWKVDLTYNAEGKGKIATFWLTTKKNGTTVVSDKTHNVAQGSGAHYYDATSKASQRDVRLAAENNNDSNKTYVVSGYWDEETN